MHFFFSIHQLRVITYLFQIDRMPMKYKFSENMNLQQFFPKTTILAASFDVN